MELEQGIIVYYNSFQEEKESFNKFYQFEVVGHPDLSSLNKVKELEDFISGLIYFLDHRLQTNWNIRSLPLKKINEVPYLYTLEGMINEKLRVKDGSEYIAPLSHLDRYFLDNSLQKYFTSENRGSVDIPYKDSFQLWGEHKKEVEQNFKIDWPLDDWREEVQPGYYDSLNNNT